MAITYNGFYKDSWGTHAIEVINDFRTLTTEIDGVVFTGSEFDDLSVDDKSKYTAEQLSRFTFLKTPIYQTYRFVETLCNCSIEVVMPQVVIDKLNNKEFSSDLTITTLLGSPRSEPGRGIDHESVTLSLTITGANYSGISSDFEGAFDGIYKQIKNNYHFKNCYGCLYSDYSVYGQSTFGSMLCFRNQKEAYSKVTTKAEYLKLGAPAGYVQETYCCDEFEIRKGNVGYR
ncbi:hypothetical protein A4D02_26115 [Niastella koreensis]|nr:DUF6304 family protein [Niastella koreensis]OQP51590.1 hypothetical protein A4D02_26115 [Niastella koreensis]